MNRQIEKMIPRAMVAIRELLFNEDEMIPKEYDGYAASLGAAIRNSGLIPALSFYTDVNRSKGKARRYKLLMAISYCMGISENLGENNETTDKRFLLDYIIARVYGEEALKPKKEYNRRADKFDEFAVALPSPNGSSLEKYRKKVISASIALKLAMRNFPQEDK